MTREELARAIGCTPDTAPEMWSVYTPCAQDEPIDKYYREDTCLLPDPFDASTPPEALNRWLEWAVPWLADNWHDLCVSRHPALVYYWYPTGDSFEYFVDYTIDEHPGVASIAACVALLELGEGDT